jgi:PAS domain S-box-containing protein
MPAPFPDDAAFRALAASSDDAIISTDLGGIITSWNPAAERLLGHAAAAAVGQPVALIVPAAGEAVEQTLRARASRGESVRHVETVARRQDGADLRVALTVVPIRSAAGDVTGLLRILRDVHGGPGPAIAAQRLAAIVESSEDAIVSKDLTGIVTSWNQAAERMFGYGAAEMIGASIRTIVPADRQSEEDEVLARMRRGERVEHFETLRRRKDGTLVPISLTVSPIHDADGTVVGASKVARDISERKQGEAERDRLLALTQEHAAITDTLNRVGAVVASSLDRTEVVQAVTDAATELTGAAFGAFFYDVVDEQGQSYTLHTIAGAAKAAFDDFAMPPSTAAFDSAFRGTGIIRSDDVTQDRRYGQTPPYLGVPPGQLSVRSYLAVPVKARSGDVLGGLVFGHPDTHRFSEQHERLVAGIAAWASVALENARLYVGVRDVNRLKDEFLATLSHELRTPLNAILGYTRMLRMGAIQPEHWERALETIERNGASLTQIVEDVLDISRFISGKMRLNVQAVDLPQIVRHAVEAVIPAADAKSIRVDVIVDPRAAPISGDPERLQQVIWNLLSNAVKFTPKQGKVQVYVERVNSHVEVVVSDTGVGISSEFLPHVFEHFRQEDAKPSRERGGLGLGLSIARQLVEMHGGTIHAASGGPGQGSTFRVKLPLRIVHPETHVEQTRVHPAAPRADTEGAAAPPDLHGIRVLAVDDDRDARAMVRDILEARGADVRTAASALEALVMLEAARPDVLVADIGMPQMDGFELIAQLRQHDDPAMRSLPAAALTAYARSQDRSRALRSGYHLHLAKPIEPSELIAAVAALARRTS